jgi:hypothetical protein
MDKEETMQAETSESVRPVTFEQILYYQTAGTD